MTYCPHGCHNGWVTDHDDLVECPVHTPKMPVAIGIPVLKSSVLAEADLVVSDDPGTLREIEDLNAMAYGDYLQTPHWHRERKSALKRVAYRCETCGASETMLDVHHLTYERRGCEEPGDLLVLCRACHDKAHGVAS